MNTPNEQLLAAASSGDVAGVEHALASGACVDAVNTFGSTPLVCAATDGHVDVAKLLIARGTNLERRAGWGLSALHQAASWERSEMVTALLDAGAQVDGTTVDGTTSLMIAAARGNLPIVRWLLDR